MADDESSGDVAGGDFWADLEGVPGWLHRLGELLPVQPQAVYISFDPAQEFEEERDQRAALLVLNDGYLSHYEIAAQIDYWRQRGNVEFTVQKSMVPLSAIKSLASSVRVGSRADGKQTIGSIQGRIVLDRPLGDLGSALTLPMQAADYGNDRRLRWDAAKSFLDGLSHSALQGSRG